MEKLDLGPLGIALSVDRGGAHLAAAAAVEDLGYSTIWVAGGQLDSLDRITELVGATRAIRVAPAIIPVEVYPASAVLRLHAELESTAPGRFVAGLGGPQRPRHLRALAGYLDELDAGNPPVPAQRRIIAALGPRKLELARDRAAGAIALLVDPEWTAGARGVLGERAALVVDQMIVLDEDPDRARETARGPLRFLAGVVGYRANFARMGFADAEIEAPSDRLVDAVVAWGDPQTIVDRVHAQWAAGADQVLLSVLHGDGQPGELAVARLLAAALLP
jgi:probable F420-dependent oxidoreductase